MLPHAFIAKQQSAFLNHCKENLKDNEYVVISDFSENYSFVVQDAIQGWHWTNSQCTIHPFSIYSKENGTIKHTSFIIIAESLKHNHRSVYLFQQKLFAYLNRKFGIIKKITFFSDGASSQYKNKKNFFNICQYKKKYGFDVEWHCFATSHGKGPCDAIGGVLKRLAAKASLQRIFENHILTANDLFNWATKSDGTMDYEFCSIIDQENIEKELDSTHDFVKTIEGTRTFHAFLPIDEETMDVKVYSFSTKTLRVRLIKN